MCLECPLCAGQTLSPHWGPNGGQKFPPSWNQQRDKGGKETRGILQIAVHTEGDGAENYGK